MMQDWSDNIVNHFCIMYMCVTLLHAISNTFLLCVTHRGNDTHEGIPWLLSEVGLQ